MCCYTTTYRNCAGRFIDIEYYQDFTHRIELTSYKEYNDRYFTTRNEVNFWWTNSDGYLIIPINNVDPKTFQPFQNICGGIDKKGIYYGSPNFGVNQLNIPINSVFKFIEKKIAIGKHELKRGYFCELDKTHSKEKKDKL